jgi:hypothetical protein
MTDEMKEKREGLKAISRLIQQLVKAGQYESVNEGLVDMYAKQGHTEIHSFKKWMEQGYIVRKGEKALLLWGEPKKAFNQEKQTEGEKDEFKFFPLAYVFSQKQVEPMKQLTR